jgi:hypothetical protein
MGASFLKGAGKWKLVSDLTVKQVGQKIDQLLAGLGIEGLPEKGI